MNIIKSIPAPVRPVTLASIVCLLGTSQCWAASPANPPTQTVRYADLDLSTASGASTLYRRIKGAALTVCGTEGGSLVEIAHWHGCVNAAIGEAVASVNSPLLTALYSGNRSYSATAMLDK